MTPKDLEQRPIADLTPYARNSRTHSEAQVAQIAASITEFGFTDRNDLTQFMVGEYEPLVAATQAEKLLRQIHKGYNYNGSDPMTDYFDVRYYGTVTIMTNTRYGMFFGKVK